MNNRYNEESKNNNDYITYDDDVEFYHKNTQCKHANTFRPMEYQYSHWIHEPPLSQVGQEKHENFYYDTQGQDFNEPFSQKNNVNNFQTTNYIEHYESSVDILGGDNKSSVDILGGDNIYQLRGDYIKSNVYDQEIINNGKQFHELEINSSQFVDMIPGHSTGINLSPRVYGDGFSEYEIPSHLNTEEMYSYPIKKTIESESISNSPKAELISKRTRKVSHRKSITDSTLYDDEDDQDFVLRSDRNRKKKKGSSQRTRLPKNTLQEWGFDAEDIKREYDLDIKLSGENFTDKRGYRWTAIAKKIGNKKFLESGDCGTKLKALLRRDYPEIVGLKIKVPSDPKKSWGFTADDVVDKIEELKRQNKKFSLSKIGSLLGHKTSTDCKKKAFSERSDRGQLVHALLHSKYPELAKNFERHSKN